MYQNDGLPLLSTFCKFQRLKVKGSRVMLVCLHQHSRTREWSDVADAREWSDVADATCASCSHSEIQLFCGSSCRLKCTLSLAVATVAAVELSIAVATVEALSQLSHCCRSPATGSRPVLAAFLSKSLSHSCRNCRNCRSCRTVAAVALSQNCRIFLSHCRTGAQLGARSARFFLRILVFWHLKIRNLSGLQGHVGLIPGGRVIS